MAELAKKNFEDFYLSDSILQALGDVGYKDPTPVQESSIPLIMAGIDLIVQSQTGTGKTAAFAIPILEMLDPHPGRVEVLVLAPTRELARQVSEEFGRLATHKAINCATIYGGASYEKQYKDLETAQIVAATPGRLLDHLKRGTIDLSMLRILVLDEADEMLSMGFAEELNAILGFLPEERQSLLYSATVTEEVKSLAGSMLYYPEFVTHSSDSVAAEDVTHSYYAVSGVGRARDLLKVLEYHEPENAIIFANTRDDTFLVTSFLKRHGLKAEVLNGDLPQKERERTLGLLRAGEIDYLVATDVAARGIDISELSHVINYTVPDSAEVYIHRTGRTGRAGKKGEAISLISPREMATLFNIRKFYQVNMQKKALPTPQELLEAKKQRHLHKLSDRLENVRPLPYGGKLGLAEELLTQSPDEDRVRLVAKLLALADQVVGRNGATAVPKLAQPPAEKEAPEVEEKPAEEAAEERSAEASTPEAAPRSKRTRREEVAATPEEAVAPEETEEPVEEAAAEEAAPEEGRRRSRTRRRESGKRTRRDDSKRRSSRDERDTESDESEVEAQAEAKAQAEPEEKPSRREERSTNGERRSGRRRRRGGKRRSRSQREREPAAAAEPAAPEQTSSDEDQTMSKMWVNMGRDHFDKADDVVEMVCYMAGMDPEDLGRVSIESSYSYVEVREDYFYDIINAMNNQEWNGVTVAAEPARK